MDIITWIISNWAYILSGFLGLIIVASIVVKLTPNEKDDAFLTGLVNFLDRFSLVKTENDKKMIEIAKEYLKKDNK